MVKLSVGGHTKVLWDLLDWKSGAISNMTVWPLRSKCGISNPLAKWLFSEYVLYTKMLGLKFSTKSKPSNDTKNNNFVL